MTSQLKHVKLNLPGVWALTAVQLYPTLDTDADYISSLDSESIFGRVVFTHDRYMNGTVTLNNQRGTKFSSASWSLLTDEEILSIARPMSTYSGPWDLLEKDGEVVLRVLVDIALNPAWVGQPQDRRKVEIVEGPDKSLVLSLTPIDAIPMPVSVCLISDSHMSEKFANLNDI
jgi:hypothetical protein